MKRKEHARSLLAAVGSLAIAGGLAAQSGGSASSELKDRLIFDARLRHETVNQEWGGDADALTLRTRLGYESARYNGFTFLVEGEFSGAGDEDAFDAYPTPQGGAGMAQIFDGETAELNRAQIGYEAGDFAATVGRQRIILDNARFIGNVGWRQNEQTFDAARIEYSFDPGSKLTYIYLDRATRIFGSEAEAKFLRRLELDSHALHYAYRPDAQNQFGLYVYDVATGTLPSASSLTYGGFYQGDAELEDGWKLTSRFEFARQTENGASPPTADYSLDYWHAMISGKRDALSLGAGWEQLGGNGVVGFATPLATLHAFNGWADAFLATPGNGLVDQYGWIGYALSPTVSTQLAYHFFEAERGGLKYAEELDAQVSWKAMDGLTLTAKYANYNGAGVAPGLLKIDRDKLWLQIEYSY